MLPDPFKENIQKREGRWVIADLVGKRFRVPTVQIPDAAKSALDDWLAAAGIEYGLLFRQLLKKQPHANSADMRLDCVEDGVTAAKAAGIDHLSPHDLRRWSAKF